MEAIKNTGSSEYGRFCLETKHGLTIDIGNMTIIDSVREAQRGIEGGWYYDIDFFTWNGELLDIQQHQQQQNKR